MADECVISSFSHVRHFATQWIVALQASLSMAFSRKECWSWLPCPPPGDLPNPEIELHLLRLCNAGRFFTAEPPQKPNKTETRNF